MIKKIFHKNNKKTSTSFINKHKKDYADGTLVFFITSLPFLISTLSLVVGISQSVEDQRNLDNIFQDATQHAVAYIGTDGHLNGASIEQAAKEIKQSLDPNDTSGKYAVKDSTNGYRLSNYQQDKYGNNIGFKLCNADIDFKKHNPDFGIPKINNKQYAFVVGLDKDRKLNYNSSSILKRHYSVYTNGTGSGDLSWSYNSNNNYKVIYVEGLVNLTDYIANPFDPDYNGCRVHHVYSSAIAFGSSADVNYGDKNKKGEGGDFDRKQTIEEKLGIKVESFDNYKDEYGNNPF